MIVESPRKNFADRGSIPLISIMWKLDLIFDIILSFEISNPIKAIQN